jgi:hypothetical protein
MYNNYAAVKTFWSDTMNMDDLRGATFVNGGPGWDVITYDLLDQTGDNFPSDLSALHPVGHGRVQTLDFHGDFAIAVPGTPDAGFALVATGALSLPAGPHTFCTTSSDGAWLYLDGSLLLSNRGRHGPDSWQVCRTTTLAGGAHTVLVNFLSRGGGGVLEVTLDGAFLTPDGKAAPGVLEGYSSPDGVGGFGNTAHTYSGDTFY